MSTRESRSFANAYWIVASWSCLLVYIGGVAFPVSSTSADEVTPAAAALETIFSPNRNPPNRTMGLVQRNFLDLIESSKGRLQIAVVIDGTESMDTALSGIKQTIERMMDDLELYKHAEVAYQLVVYRDSGSPSGGVSFPCKVAGKKFVADRNVFRQAFSSIQTETGAPYFNELADLGIHSAIQELEWAKDEDTTKWIMVVGDAPPFDVGFEEASTDARRHFETQHLAGLANLKNIRISCILSSSREQERASYESVLGRTRQFMNTLSSETGGLMLDLSYPDIRDAILSAASQSRADYAEVGKITRQEVDELREQARQAQSVLSESRRVQIAVLPHLPLSEMDFRADRPEVKIATDMRRRFRNLPGLEVKSSRAVRQRLKELQARDLEDAQLLQMLATTLGVDYVLWGIMHSQNGLVQLDSSLYRGVDGRKIVSGRGRQESADDATRAVIADVVNTLVANRSEAKLVSVFNSIRDDDDVKTALTTPVSNVKEAVSPLLEAYDLLEQAAGIESGDSDATAFLTMARITLDTANQADPGNPIVHQLMASCCFNQAQMAERKGDHELAQREFAAARAALERAKIARNRSSITDDIKTEILADYALLAEKDIGQAIRLYETLTNASANGPGNIQMHIALRAHWMLAGVRCGDWGVEEEFVDPAEAKEHLKAILAYWPKSPEADYIRTKLRWNARAGETAFEHYPHQGPAFLDLIE